MKERHLRQAHAVGNHSDAFKCVDRNRVLFVRTDPADIDFLRRLPTALAEIGGSTFSID